MFNFSGKYTFYFDMMGKTELFFRANTLKSQQRNEVIYLCIGPVRVCFTINFPPSTAILSEFASVFLPSINKWLKISVICRHQLPFCQSLHPFSCHQSINGCKCPQSVAINELMTENVHRPPSSMN
jgi:hypothetical protein